MGNPISVRLARLEDLGWCAAQDHHVPEAIVRTKIDAGEIVVAELDGQLVAYLRLEYLWSTIPYIALIFVLDEYRAQRIGRAVLGFLEEFLRQRNHRLLLSSSQANEPDPQAWHRAVGFEECGILTGINDGGIGEVFFRKAL